MFIRIILVYIHPACTVAPRTIHIAHTWIDMPVSIIHMYYSCASHFPTTTGLLLTRLSLHCRFRESLFCLERDMSSLSNNFRSSSASTSNSATSRPKSLRIAGIAATVPMRMVPSWEVWHVRGCCAKHAVLVKNRIETVGNCPAQLPRPV